MRALIIQNLSVNSMYYFLFKLINELYAVIIKHKFKCFGKYSYIRPRADYLFGERYIEIGSNTVIGKHVQLTAWDSNNGQTYYPSIVVGSNCQFGSYNHITAINCIRIGDGVLTGKFVTISDNSHGDTTLSTDLDKSPIKRPVFSKGPVIIGDNVWIGDKATILANVKIGKGSIIGANAVVTKDVPPYSMAVGSPAKVIKTLGGGNSDNNLFVREF